MAPERIAGAIFVATIAFLSLILNDVLRARKPLQTALRHPPGTLLGIVIGVILVAFVLAAETVIGPGASTLTWVVLLAPIGAFVLLLIFALRKVIWLYMKGLATGRLPGMIRRNAAGQLELECPKCSATVPVTQGEIGTTAFVCPTCGESGKWTFKV